MGDSLELHPITILLCLIFWGMIWGVPGMLLAAPMTAAAKMVFESMAVTLPLAQLLAGTVNDHVTATDADLEAGVPPSPPPHSHAGELKGPGGGVTHGVEGGIGRREKTASD